SAAWNSRSRTSCSSRTPPATSWNRLKAAVLSVLLRMPGWAEATFLHSLERRLGVGTRLLRFGERDQPGRCQGGSLRATWLPLIGPARSVPARRPNDIAAVAADIDTGTDLASAVADFDIGVPNPNLVPATAWRGGYPGGRKRTTLRNQLIERGLAVD